MPAKGQFKDYSGQVIGNRLILERDFAKGSSKDPAWKNKCLTCGHVSSIGMSAIRKAIDSKQCTKCMDRLHKRAVDVRGQTFHKWTVTGPTVKTPTAGYQAMARCSCGTEKMVPVYNMIRGLSKSCGCTHRTRGGLSQTPEGKLWTAAKMRAEKSGIPFSIEIKDVVIPTHCPVLGIELEQGGATTPSSPSIDKLIPALGYVPGNIEVISWRANKIKSDASLAELEAITAWMRGKKRARLAA